MFLHSENEVQLPVFLSEWLDEFLCLQAVRTTTTNTVRTHLPQNNK